MLCLTLWTISHDLILFLSACVTLGTLIFETSIIVVLFFFLFLKFFFFVWTVGA